MIILRNGLILFLVTLLFGCGSIPKTKVVVSPATIKLMKAAKSGNEQLVKKMLKTGLNINVKDANGWTALHMASFGGHTDMAKFLIKKGIKVDAKDVDDWTALLVASANNRINVARLLLQKRANVNVKDLDGMTPLHIAAINNYFELAKILIKNGADVNATNNDNITPLQLALSLRRSNEMIVLLAQKSPDAEAVQKDNYKEIKNKIVVTPPKKSVTTTKDTLSSEIGKINLTSPQPLITGNMQFNYSYSRYDTYYTNPPHWKIVYLNGYMNFSFNGVHDFKFHALGSTSKGISYCYVDIYVNEKLFESNKFIDAKWKDYIIPRSIFRSGRNSVKILLRGDTHFWIDRAAIGSFRGSNDKIALLTNKSPDAEAVQKDNYPEIKKKLKEEIERTLEEERIKYGHANNSTEEVVNSNSLNNILAKLVRNVFQGGVWLIRQVGNVVVFIIKVAYVVMYVVINMYYLVAIFGGGS